MEVIYKSIYTIDYEEGKIYKRTVPEDFNEYIDKLIVHINTNTSVREYKSRSQHTQVINSIRDIIAQVLSEKDKNEINDLVFNRFEDIANRLLIKEIEKQDQISKLGTNVKKGSLIQALLADMHLNEYTFMLAKVEHTGFYDEEDFAKKIGFPSDKNNIWKSCAMECIVNEDDIAINKAKIYLDGSAKYWSNEFLELDEMLSDDKNTYNSFKAIDSVLRTVKPKGPNDYIVLRNAILGYLKTPQHIDYDTMLDQILGDYHATDLEQEDIKNLKNKLHGLPEKKSFDRQFNSSPSAISARILKKTYPVNIGIEINIKDHVEDINNTIMSVEEPGGERFLKIRTNNEETFRAFFRPNR